MQSAADELIQEGIRRGEARGKAEGEAKGKAEAVLAVLAARNIAVSAQHRARVLACTEVPTLERWLVAAVTCSSADARFTH